MLINLYICIHLNKNIYIFYVFIDAMLPNNNSYQCHQVTNSDRNILDSNYRRTQFDDDFLQPNIPSMLSVKYTKPKI